MAPSNMDPAAARMAREDSVPVGNARPARILGLPYPLVVVIVGVGYIIQTNVGGWKGLGWALAVSGPAWFGLAVLVRNDPFGANVTLAWLRTCAALRDPMGFGAPSLSPLPARFSPRYRRTTDA